MKALYNKKKIKIPISVLNIGGISNITQIDKNFKIFSEDIGPGNCLIDRWVRKNSNKHYDENGSLAKKGKVDKFIFDQYLENYHFSKIKSNRSLDDNFIALDASRVFFGSLHKIVAQPSGDITE